MDNKKKCSNKKHSEINAISYCSDCNLYLCNKCTNIHYEYLEIHHIYNLDSNNQEIFTGKCYELNHKNDLEFYCKNHNQLCCAVCLCKIKTNGKGQHNECEVCLIKEIKDEKINKLKENIKYLEESYKKIQDSINKLKEIYEKINLSKEELKMKIINTFTKIRNLINEREDKLLLAVDNLCDNTFFKEDIIKKGEKIPNQIKTILEKGKTLGNEWDNNKLIDKINDCINIENNIKNIIIINENIEKYSTKQFNIKFFPENEQIDELSEKIKQFGEIMDEENNLLNFKFQSGENYKVTNNGLIATKIGKNDWNCVIFGDKEVPKNKISKWKIKIIQDKKNKDYSDIFIGIGPLLFKGNAQFDECWSIFSHGNKIALKMQKNQILNYNNHKENLKKDDIIEVIVDRKLGNLSFAINDINYGIACSTIPKEDIFYPTIGLYEKGLSVEII